MFNAKRLFAFALLAISSVQVSAQKPGSLTAEVHPKLSSEVCTASGCVKENTSVVLDSNWRWFHEKSGSKNCYDGNSWLCSSPESCINDCVIEGAGYQETYGITTSGDALTLKFVTKGPHSTNIGSRVYLMDKDDKGYRQYKVKNREFTFDVDVSKLPCGLNGALYFSEMDPDGGASRFPGNTAGAKYGTGYCDAQCPHDVKFINGEANQINWNPSDTDPNAGIGKYGTCCPEMDIWEANSMATAYTPHPCSINGQSRCEGTACGDSDAGERYEGTCDKDGCDFNSFRMGNKSFYGKGKTIDTSKKMTVVTQFITADGTDNGPLSEIRRVYVQDGKVVQNSNISIPGIDPVNSLTDKVCDQQKSVFGDETHYQQLGGMERMGDSLEIGATLVMSIWADHAAHMLWLDSTYPTDSDPSVPGKMRGECDITTGDPDDMEKNHGDAQVTFSKIRFGTLGSTYASGGTNPGNPGTGTTTTVSTRTSTTSTRTTPTPTPTPTNPGSSCSQKWQQCGGNGYSGPTCCVSGSTCRAQNQWYSQCL